MLTISRWWSIIILLIKYGKILQSVLKYSVSFWQIFRNVKYWGNNRVKARKVLRSAHISKLLVISFRVCLGIPFFYLSFPTKILYAFLFSHMPSTSHFHGFDHPNNIWRRVRMKLFITQFSPSFFYFCLLRSNYCSRHPFAIHHRFVLFPQLFWSLCFW
jgi:hypothetical protein